MSHDGTLCLSTTFEKLLEDGFATNHHSMRDKVRAPRPNKSNAFAFGFSKNFQIQVRFSLVVSRVRAIFLTLKAKI
jgi:hypothetical protein